MVSRKSLEWQKNINTALSGNLWLWQPCSNHNLLCFWNKSLDQCFLNEIISGLHLQVTGRMNNADNPITTSCFFPIFFPHIALHVQFEVTYLTISVPRAFFSFCHRKLYSLILCIFFKYESQIEPGPSQLTPLMQLKIKGAHSLCEN